MSKKIKLLVKKAEYKEVGIDDYVRLLEDYILIKANSVGKIIGFTREERVKVEFPMMCVGFISPDTKPRRGDRFLEVDASNLEAVNKLNAND